MPRTEDENDACTGGKPLAVYGMEGARNGANPLMATVMPAQRRLTEEDVRQITLAIGMDNVGFSEELKRLVRIGALEHNPRNWALIVKSCKDNAEMMLLAATKGSKVGGLTGDPKQFVLQIINNLNITANDLAREAESKMRRDPAMRARYEAEHVMEAIITDGVESSSDPHQIQPILACIDSLGSPSDPSPVSNQPNAISDELSAPLTAVPELGDMDDVEELAMEKEIGDMMARLKRFREGRVVS